MITERESYDGPQQVKMRHDFVFPKVHVDTNLMLSTKYLQCLDHLPAH